MSNEDLNSQIATLERKVKLMISEHQKMKESLSNYRTENQELKSKIESKETELSAFQNKFKIGKIVENMAARDGDSEQLKGVIDQYIKEIDKCIVHLSET